ncbi:PTS glucose transporter subunit IIA [bacterium]|nr:PTS glucose transporter subunit IIA [bacterium]
MEKIIYSPLTGKVLPLEEVPDTVFAQKIVGDGTAIEPSFNIAYAPIDGVVSAVVKGGHALTIKDEDGLEILVHIGIDTVKLKGDGFKCFVKEGDKVKKGEKIIEFDMEKIERAGLPLVSPIVVITQNCEILPLNHFGQLVQAAETPIIKVTITN